jgi:hypothetical protein
MSWYHNSEGYYDPTMGAALSHIQHDFKRRKQNVKTVQAGGKRSAKWNASHGDKLRRSGKRHRPQSRRGLPDCLPSGNILSVEKSSQKECRELERFFRSDWYKKLTSVDGEYLIQILRKQALEDCL